MGGHPKIIITTPNLNWALAPSILEGVRKLLSVPVDFFKHPIRMIHFFLQDLALEKLVILKSNVCKFKKENLGKWSSTNFFCKNISSKYVLTCIFNNILFGLRSNFLNYCRTFHLLQKRTFVLKTGVVRGSGTGT